MRARTTSRPKLRPHVGRQPSCARGRGLVRTLHAPADLRGIEG